MQSSDYKDFGSLLVLVISRNSLEVTFALGLTAVVAGLWTLAPLMLGHL